MVVLPIILWWSFSYIVKAKETDIDKDRWFTGALSSLGCAIITIPLLYYFYTNAFGIESLIIDILLLFVAITFGQLLGLHIYSNSKGIDAKIAFFLIIAVLSIFILFTFVTPQLPIFMDGQTGNYGR
jgi:peptidoglycan/LPS O-acetylase OafA/YrhL